MIRPPARDPAPSSDRDAAILLAVEDYLRSKPLVAALRKDELIVRAALAPPMTVEEAGLALVWALRRGWIEVEPQN